jgi:glycosyltransferase involved in cell wall biosynthesis
MILYLGYFGPHRGLDTVIEAMPEILKNIPNAIFVVVGNGSLQPNLEAQARKLGVGEHVHFLGFKPYAQVGSWMKRADINITPHKRNEHTDHTVPHKLFHSMMSGKPTLVSTAPPLARIIHETQGGFVFEAENATSLSKAVIEISDGEDKVDAASKRALEATRGGSYNWNTDLKILTQIYERL